MQEDETSVLDNVMLYGLTNTATSSAQPYWESLAAFGGLG